MDLLQDAPSIFDLHTELRWRGLPESTRDLLKIAMTIAGSPGLSRAAETFCPFYRKVRTRLDHNFTLFKILSGESGPKVIVDTSKIPIRMKLLYMHHPDKVRIVYLVRDGRAVFASIKRYALAAPEVRLRRWVRVHDQCRLLLRSVPDEHWKMIRYEDLCTDPTGTMKALTEFLDLDYDPAMLRFAEPVHHDVGGSPSKFLSSSEIRSDERWRNELSDDDLEVFAKIGSKTQKRMGYPQG